ncbi:MAG: hypothetical protein ACRDHZ_04030, partial [Ktedonobacteraceae bacterium]
NAALGYAWYVGTAGNEVLQTITTVPTAAFSKPLTSGTQAATAVTADNSRNANLAFDGLLTTALNPANDAYVNAVAGAVLTASTKGSVNEIDAMLKSMWDKYRVSPTVLYVNSQEQQNITVKVLNASSTPLLRYTTNGTDPLAIVANGVVEYYYNPFAINGGTKIPVKVHPFLPAGTIIGWCENLPAFYQNDNVPNVAEMHIRKEWQDIEWPLVTRSYQHGIYVEETLAVYAPFGMGVITGIGNG